MTVPASITKRPSAHEPHEPIAHTAAPAPTLKQGRGRLIVLTLVAVLVGGAGLVFATNKVARDRIVDLSRSTLARVLPSSHEAEPHPEAEPISASKGPWKGVIEIDQAQSDAIALAVETVKAQNTPLPIFVDGSLTYDPRTQTHIRPKFSSLIDRVYVELGTKVKPGDPLLDLFSPELAAAKIDYEKKGNQWDYDRREVERSKQLLATKSIAEKEYLADVNDEKKSAAEYKLAKDQLMLLGLSDAEIAHIPQEDGTAKAKITIRAQTEGVVIRRDVVKGNRYDEADVLMVIAPLDHLWVWGNVYPDDASQVTLGQTWVVTCPSTDESHKLKVETIGSDIDKETKTLRIGARIENPKGRLKAEMLVRGHLELPPTAGRCMIPRVAMVSIDGADYVFVRQPGDANHFTRRPIVVIQERSEYALVGEGLEPGEVIATRGSLLLAQMYEDSESAETGTPP